MNAQIHKAPSIPYSCPPIFPSTHPSPSSPPLKIQDFSQDRMVEHQLKGIYYNCDEKYKLKGLYYNRDEKYFLCHKFKDNNSLRPFQRIFILRNFKLAPMTSLIHLWKTFLARYFGDGTSIIFAYLDWSFYSPNLEINWLSQTSQVHCFN